MAYIHDGDLPANYPLGEVVETIALPDARERWLDAAMERNYLNKIGRYGVHFALSRIYGEGTDEVALGDVGAATYIIATMPEFTGIDHSSEPGYVSFEGERAAKNAAYSLGCQDELETIGVALRAVNILEEDAPRVTALTEIVGFKVTGSGAESEEVRQIKTGAALMRMLGVTAQFLLQGGDMKEAVEQDRLERAQS